MASKVPVQILHLSSSPRYYWLCLYTKTLIGVKMKRGEELGQSEKSLCSELKIEHLKPNCCLETQIAGNYGDRLQWGENR